MKLRIEEFINKSLYAGVRQWISDFSVTDASQLLPDLYVPSNETLGISESVLEGVEWKEFHDPIHQEIWFGEFNEEAVSFFLKSFNSLHEPLMISVLKQAGVLRHVLTCSARDSVEVSLGFHTAFRHCYLKETQVEMGADDWFTFSQDFRSEPWKPVEETAPLEFIYPALDGVEEAFLQVIFYPLKSGWGYGLMDILASEELLQRRVKRSRGSEDFSERLNGQLFAVYIRSGSKDESSVAKHLLKGMESSCREIRMSSVLSPIEGRGFVLSSSELGALLPMPDRELQSSIAGLRMNSRHSGAGELRGINVGFVSVHGEEEPVVWSDNKRTTHMLVSGTTGSGKSVVLANIALEIAERGEGLAIIDPHNTAILHFLRSLDETRLKDCILFDASDSDHLISLGLFDPGSEQGIESSASHITHQLLSLFDRRDMGYVITRGLQNTVRTILSVSGLVFSQSRLLLEQSHRGERFRSEICDKLTDELLLDYWLHEFSALDSAAVGRIRSRIDRVLENQILRKLLSIQKPSLSFKEIIDGKKVFLANTSPIGAGPDVANIIGALIQSGLQGAAMSRKTSSFFTIISDEFGNYSNPRDVLHSLRTIRKFNVSQILATQNVSALPDDVLGSLGNVSSHLVLKQGWTDAQFYQRFFGSTVDAQKLMNLQVGNGFFKSGNALSEYHSVMPYFKREKSIYKLMLKQSAERFPVNLEKPVVVSENEDLSRKDVL